MTVSFYVDEEIVDFTEWFIRCADNEIRDSKRFPYQDNDQARKEVREYVKVHNASCEFCAKYEQGAELEVASLMDDLTDIDISDEPTRVILDALALPATILHTIKGEKETIFGYAEATDLQGRILMALAFIEPDGKEFSSQLSNRELINYLHKLYDLSHRAQELNREITWLGYPED